jgi:hypothetical protein
MPRPQDIVFIIVFLLGILLGPRFLGDGDPGRHIVVGNIILTERTIPRIDVFSQTKSGLPLTTTEWLSEAIYAAAYRVMGLNGVVLLAILLVATTITLIFRETFRVSRSFLISFCLFLLVVPATLFHWLARPHLFSWLAFAIWVPWMDELARGERRNVWQFPLLMLLWANLHGGFILGFLVWGAYLAGWLVDYFVTRSASFDILKRLVMVGLFSFLATLLNPSGIGLWNNVFGHVGDRVLMNLQIDWQSPNFHNFNTWPFLFLAALMIFFLSRRNQSLSGGQTFLLMGMTTLGLYSVRNIPFFVSACVPIIGFSAQFLLKPGLLQKTDRQIQVIQAGLRGSLWSMITVIVVASLLISGQTLDAENLGNTFNPKIFPVRAVDWLSAHPQSGNVFNEFTWGGYLLFRLWPEQRVFIDGQTDFYGPGLVMDYLTMLDAKDNWGEALEKYKIDWVLLPKDSSLVKMLIQNPQWHILYEDETSIILRK